MLPSLDGIKLASGLSTLASTRYASAFASDLTPDDQLRFTKPVGSINKLPIWSYKSSASVTGKAKIRKSELIMSPVRICSPNSSQWLSSCQVYRSNHCLVENAPALIAYRLSIRNRCDGFQRRYPQNATGHRKTSQFDWQSKLQKINLLNIQISLGPSLNWIFLLNFSNPERPSVKNRKFFHLNWWKLPKRL